MMTRAIRHVLTCMIVGGVASHPGAIAGAQDGASYALDNEQWDGLSGLLETAEELGIDLSAPPQISLRDLDSSDSLLIVYPRGAVPANGVARFLHAGGRVAIADDFGSGGAFLELYGIERRSLDSDAHHALYFRNNRRLPVARAVAEHPLSVGVRALVANHAQALAHSELAPIFAFDGQGTGLVLTGAIEQGRLVAISDPSSLINNMLEFRGNARFARNLLQYLNADGHGRVLLVTADTVLLDDLERTPPSALNGLSEWLDNLARANAPPSALIVGAVVLVALLVIVAMSALPRRSPYVNRLMFPQPAPAGGFVGRILFFGNRPDRLIHPALVYKFELEGELIRHLDLHGGVLLRDVVNGLRQRDLPEADIQAMRDLLVELAELQARQDHPPSPPKVSRTRLHRIVHTGDRILRELEQRQ